MNEIHTMSTSEPNVSVEMQHVDKTNVTQQSTPNVVERKFMTLTHASLISFEFNTSCIKQDPKQAGHNLLCFPNRLNNVEMRCKPYTVFSSSGNLCQDLSQPFYPEDLQFADIAAKFYLLNVKCTQRIAS